MIMTENEVKNYYADYWWLLIVSRGGHFITDTSHFNKCMYGIIDIQVCICIFSVYSDLLHKIQGHQRTWQAFLRSRTTGGEIKAMFVLCSVLHSSWVYKHDFRDSTNINLKLPHYKPVFTQSGSKAQTLRFICICLSKMSAFYFF